MMISVSWALFCGKDMNWDQLNYHFYTAYNLLDGRLEKDFMAASIQGYLNPLGYVPFYWMVTHNWHSVVIATVLACVHALNLILIYRICRTIIPPSQIGARTAAVLGTVLAMLSPVYLLELGTSFIDITTSSLVLLGLLLGLRCRQLHTDSVWTHPALLAGVCIGAATGLKSTNVIFGPALAIALFFVVPNRNVFWKAELRLVAGAFLGTVVTYGYWGYLLWHEFGNPFFPYFNSIFLSPDFFPISFQHQRFLPQSPLDYLTLPFRMVELRSWVYLENFVPDLRFAVLLIVGAATGLYCVKKRKSTDSDHSVFSPEAAAAITFLFVSYFLWVWSSGNGRYGIVVSLLCGPAIAQLVFWLSHSNLRVGTILLAIFIAAQCVHVGQGLIRWSVEPWTPRWFDVEFSDNLARESALYLSIGAQSNSYLFPYLHRNSAFTNPIGQVSIGLDSPGGARLRNLIGAHAGRIKLLSKLPIHVDSNQNAATRNEIARMDLEVAHLGFEVDDQKCTTITTAGPNDAPLSAPEIAKKGPRQLLICDARERTLSQNEATERMRIEQLFESVRRWCPALFGAAGSIVERQPSKWSLFFIETDVTLTLYHRHLTAFVPQQSRSLILGRQGDWQNGIRKYSCAEALTILRIR